MDWIRENQPFVNLGLLVGAIFYTIITGFILRVSARQLRTMVQPVLTLKGSPLEAMSSDGQLFPYTNELKFQNSGNGAALNVVIQVKVDSGTSDSRFPEFDTTTKRLPYAVRAGDDWGLLSPGSAVKTTFGPTGAPSYDVLHQFEIFISYASIAGSKYLTHVSIGQAGSIDSFSVGKRSGRRCACIWVGICWRFYRQRVPIWRKIRRRPRGQDPGRS